MTTIKKISDIADIVMGQSPNGSEVNSIGLGLPLLNGPTEFQERYPAPVQYTQNGRKLSEKGDILFCVRGSTTGRMNYADQPYAIGRGIAAIRGKNGYPTAYVKTVLEKNLDRLLVSATGSTFPNVGRDLLLNFEVEVNPEKEAETINRYIEATEDKIYLNQQINQTLEAMAQALFKSWFVDFEPTRAKVAVLESGGTEEDATQAAMTAISGKNTEDLAALKTTNPEAYAQLHNTASLFPSSLVESELGEIPVGWEISNFGSVSECFDRLRIPLSSRERERRQGSIPYYGATSVMDYVDEPIFDGIYLLLGEDGSVLKEDGTPFTQYIWGKSWVNNHAHVLRGKGSIPTEQLYLFINRTNIAAYVTGAVQLKLNQKNMNSIPFIKAADEINKEFSEKIGPFFSAYRAITEENDNLTQLRDSLLPKLLSGEISVDTATQTSEAV